MYRHHPRTAATAKRYVYLSLLRSYKHIRYHIVIKCAMVPCTMGDIVELPSSSLLGIEPLVHTVIEHRQKSFQYVIIPLLRFPTKKRIRFVGFRGLATLSLTLI